MSPIIIAAVIALATVLQSTLAVYNIQPLYQVSIMVELQPGNPVHICNGAIIYEKLIITTANCVHYKFGSKGKLNKLDPSVLSVVAGSTNAFTDDMRINVCGTDIANDFNTNTLENDLALLTLCESLPLGTRPDMKWIMLDDSVHVNHSCLANFFSRNSQDAVPNYYQTEELILSNNEICRNETEYPDARKDDICSIYVLPQQFDCAAADSFLAFNSDLGTGLVCKSYLVGLLSSVVTRPDPKNNCSDVVLSAMYTNIYPHLMWVYNIMAKIETEYISTPYDASLKSLVINSTQNNDKEILTTTIIPLSNGTSSVNSTAPSNSTIINPTPTNSTITNSTLTSSLLTNSTLSNSTLTYSTPTISTLTNSTLTSSILTNSTVTNSTLTNSTTWNHPNVPNTTAINLTTISSVTMNSTAATHPLTWNSTISNSTSTNSTTLAPPPTTNTIGRRPSTKPLHSTESYMHYPTPTTGSFLKSSATASIRFSAGSLLISFLSLRLIIYH